MVRFIGGFLFTLGIYLIAVGFLLFVGWVVSRGRMPRDIKNHTISIRLFFLSLTAEFCAALSIFFGHVFMGVR
jgi:hypothetical protein